MGAPGKPNHSAGNGRLRKGVGQPSKFTPDRREKILEGIRAGLPIADAAMLSGVSREAFFLWLREGRSDSGRPSYRQFAEAVDEALAHFKASKLLRIAKHGEKEWQADAWALERRFPDEFGRKTRVDGNINLTARPFIDVSKLTLEEQETLLALLRKAAPAADALPAEGRSALELMPGDVVVEAA